MKRIFAAVYVLVVATQLPHVYSVYANLEQLGWYRWTAWGAALAFEASIICFTYRIVVEKSRRKTTRLGLGFFLVASAVANATYYGLAPAVFRWAMPVFATVALPASLALFASEFGAEVQRDERRAQRIERQAESGIASDAIQMQSQPAPAPVVRFTCPQCQREWASQNALNAHSRAHNGHGERIIA